MSYELLMDQIRTLPEEAVKEVASFVMYMQYKFCVNSSVDGHNAEFLSRIDLANQQIKDGKVVVKTFEELEAMAEE
ncbi:MAG: hypothetical protein K6G00_09345 [Treponema sp.]|nr:hypothetical protein [Treponema sp.]